MNIGGVYLYKNKKPVYITEGQYDVNGRISNYWNFRYIKKDGTLGKRSGDYDNEYNKFTPIKNYKIKININLK